MARHAVLHSTWLCALTIALAGCGGSGDEAAIVEEFVPPAAVTGPPGGAAPGPRVPTAPRGTRCLAGRAISYRDRLRATAVELLKPTAAFRRPGGAVVSRFDVLNQNGVPTVFRVLEARAGRDCAPRWYRVQLPIRPNGATGWIRASGLRLYRVDTRIEIDLSDRRVVVLRGDEVVERVPAAIGKASTPTPTGEYYVNQRLLTNDPSGPWGPGGIGISAFSPVLVDWEQGGPIAIHGTNQPHTVGKDASFGCLRVYNADLRRLMELAPPGTPVSIRH